MATGTGLAAFEGAPGRIEVFEYPAGPEWAEVQAWDGWADAGQAGSSAPAAPAANDSGAEDVKAGLHAEFDRRMAEETRKAFESGRERGLKEGRQAEREAQTAGREGAERQRVRQGVELVERFAQQRENYLRAVERQLSGATEVRLKVPASELELWTEAIGLVPNLAVKPTLAAGEGMRLGDCTIETDLGSVDLGIRAQLGEIERGFFDRAGGPRAQAAGPAQGAEGGGREGGA
jgi:flagellar assembly protein FliH